MSGNQHSEVSPVPAVSVALRRRGRILTIRRRNPPNAGMLALPGGRIEAGEPLLEAAIRELREETGIEASAVGILTAFDQLDHDDTGRLSSHFVIVVVLCRWQRGEGVASDDASEIKWLEAGQVRTEPSLCASARRIAGEFLDTVR
ncbi:NUDIX hydrolase [Billgrantia pellis]|uniref:NUDIX hydrolase n=1 Tax=Billgrantia pellis TaxID=2606936 RepID=A0A7V7KGZ8_9GAMM|nr:NUDIX hydrolase [Halomonas pellis]KAA0013518.1 NUDIX hydrolase [Halomonas pellis]